MFYSVQIFLASLLIGRYTYTNPNSCLFENILNALKNLDHLNFVYHLKHVHPDTAQTIVLTFIALLNFMDLVFVGPSNTKTLLKIKKLEEKVNKDENDIKSLKMLRCCLKLDQFFIKFNELSQIILTIYHGFYFTFNYTSKV